MRPTSIAGGRLFSTVLCALAVATVARAQASAIGRLTDDALLSQTWRSVVRLGPAVSGELKLWRTDSGEWRGSIAGRDVPAEVHGDSITMRLPSGDGEFRGGVTAAPKAISGTWIQPALTGDNKRMTSAVRLLAIPPQSGHRKEYRGILTPLEDRISLYLRFVRSTDGAMSAVLRNPEGNEGDGTFRVRRVADGLELTDMNDSTRRWTASYGADSTRLAVIVTDLSVRVEFAPVASSSAVGFVSRGAKDIAAPMSRPTQGDGWRTARPSDVGLDRAKLAALVRQVTSADPSLRSAPLVHSVQVARHGKLVVDEYFFGFDRDRPHDLRSGSKMFASLLLGVVMQSGAPISPESRVYSVFSSDGPFANPDVRKADMTLAHLMTMTSGWPCDELSDGTLVGNEDVLQSQTTTRDWYRYMLDLPLSHSPGTYSGYCSGGVNLVGGAVRRIAGIWLPELFAKRIAEPLRFGAYHLDLAPNDELYLGGGAFLRPRDLLKIGQLYLNGGTWNRTRVVSREWVAHSTSCQSKVKSPCEEGYGWHLHTFDVGGRSYRAYEANGNGGQFLIVVPDLDLVVAITAGNYGNYRVWRKFRDELVPNYILAAVTDNLRAAR
jgi:CubicO group peptidase (beta-lactamase class C family)